MKESLAVAESLHMAIDHVTPPIAQFMLINFTYEIVSAILSQGSDVVILMIEKMV